MMRAIPAAYSLAAGPVNWDAGKLTNRTVAAIIAIVIARPIQVLCRRIFLEFTNVACSEMLVMGIWIQDIFGAKNVIVPIAEAASDTAGDIQVLIISVSAFEPTPRSSRKNLTT